MPLGRGVKLAKQIITKEMVRQHYIACEIQGLLTRLGFDKWWEIRKVELTTELMRVDIGDEKGLAFYQAKTRLSEQYYQDFAVFVLGFKLTSKQLVEAEEALQATDEASEGDEDV